MDSGRIFFEPSCHSNMLFLGNGDSGFRVGGRTVINMEESSKRRPFFSTAEDLYDEDYFDEQLPEKKRRLTPEQVHMLEKSFEAENKLEPERKTQLAKKLNLQPRQVAVWFQNRRARWKTKQLERDYGLLKASHDALKHKYDSLHRENESLLNEIRELKSKINGGDGKIAVKEEASLSESEEKCDLETNGGDGAAAIELNMEMNCDIEENEMIGAALFGDFKDGSSDSDSSAILNEDNNSPSAAAISSSGGILHHSPPHRFCGGGLSSAAVNVNANFGFSEASKIYQTQLVKIEEHNFFGEESCSTLFSDDQPPTLHWYCNDEWN